LYTLQTVPQVNSGTVGLTPHEGAQSLKASPGADRNHHGTGISQHDLQRGIVTAGQAEHPLGLQ
jgi:hypothetical protein